MCGIAGIFDQSLRPQELEKTARRMAGTMQHRGPDDAGCRSLGPVGMGCQRLRIIDIPGGHQPMVSSSRRSLIALNGEIYNFEAIRDDLIRQGHRFQTNSDTEVVLQAYERYGKECVSHFRGMFAFAIWDDLDKVLFVARDRFGVKPLYYYWDGACFLFGSELKAILQDSRVRREIDARSLDDFFSFNYVPAPRTIFQGIRKLRPAHTLTVSDGGIVEQQYWQLVFEPLVRSTEQIETQLDELLQEAVALNLVSDVPVGAFLSGGVDSTTIVEHMRRRVDQRIHTYSIGFSEEAFNEIPYARRVAQEFGTEQHDEIVDADGARILDTLTLHFDEPFADSSMVPTYFLSRLASQFSKACMSGDGGDENFAGYPWHVHFQQRSQESSRSAEQDYFERRTFISADMRQLFYRDSLKKQLDGYHPASVLEPHFEYTRHWEPLSRVQYVDIQTYLPGDLLVKMDRASMAHGVEVRVPFLDHKLVEFAAKIPAEFKLRGGESKYILKKVIRPRLRGVDLDRKKQGFMIPLADWLREDLAELFQNRIFERPHVAGELIDIAPVRHWWEEHRRGSQHCHRFLWALLVFDSWARRYVH